MPQMNSGPVFLLGSVHGPPVQWYRSTHPPAQRVLILEASARVRKPACQKAQKRIHRQEAETETEKATTLRF